MDKKIERIRSTFENLKGGVVDNSIYEVEEKLSDLSFALAKLKHIAYNLDDKYDISNQKVSDDAFKNYRDDLSKEIWIMTDYIEQVDNITDWLLEVV